MGPDTTLCRSLFYRLTYSENALRVNQRIGLSHCPKYRFHGYRPLSETSRSQVAKLQFLNSTTEVVHYTPRRRVAGSRRRCDRQPAEFFRSHPLRSLALVCASSPRVRIVPAPSLALFQHSFPSVHLQAHHCRDLTYYRRGFASPSHSRPFECHVHQNSLKG